ncbi:MAG TPA: hypothetical protein VN886_19400 [Acidimicrobiales bacterium]|nr:hypothetical protein [Acidimicrobiales bacterium]
MPSAAKTASKEDLNLVWRSRIKNVNGIDRSAIRKHTVRICAHAGLAV